MLRAFARNFATRLDPRASARIGKHNSRENYPAARWKPPGAPPFSSRPAVSTLKPQIQ
jgi:hypothetical protein